MIISVLLVLVGLFVIVGGLTLVISAKTSIHEIGSILTLLLGVSLIGFGLLAGALIAWILRDISERLPIEASRSGDPVSRPGSSGKTAVIAIALIGTAIVLALSVSSRKAAIEQQSSFPGSPPMYPRSSGTGFLMNSTFDYKREGDRYAAVFVPPLQAYDVQVIAAMHFLAVDAFGIEGFQERKPRPVKRGETAALAFTGLDGQTYIFIPVKRRELVGMTFSRE